MEFRDSLQRALGTAYLIERELGGGGMSRVYVAHDHALGRKVVVKILSPALTATVSVERFKREIMLSAALQHPNIVPVLSAGQVPAEELAAGEAHAKEELPFFIMPFVEGESLRARLVRGPLSIREAVVVMKDIARALAYAHGRGVIHRDIKPDNIILSGSAATVTDFGVAKAIVAARERMRQNAGGEPVHTPGGHTITHAGTSIGTPAYMAPEQAAADPATDHRADLYSLGVVAYEMLAGAPPFRGLSPQALLAAQMTERPKPVSMTRYDVPAPLERLIMRCLEKEPLQRPQSASELDRALDDPEIVSGAPALPPPMTKRRTSRRRLAALGVLLLLTGAWAARTFYAGRSAVAAAAGDSLATVAPRPGIAVLPLLASGADTTTRHLAAGIAEEIRNALGQSDGVRVASRSATEEAQRDQPTLAAIARALSATKLIEGTVQSAGGRVRVTIRLVNANDGFTEWSDTYERAANDAFGAQDAIASAVSAAVTAKLGISPRAAVP